MAWGRPLFLVLLASLQSLVKADGGGAPGGDITFGGVWERNGTAICRGGDKVAGLDDWLNEDSPKRRDLKRTVGGLASSPDPFFGYPLSNEIGSYFCKQVCGEVHNCIGLATNAPSMGAKLDPMQPAKCYLYSSCNDRAAYQPSVPSSEAWKDYTLLMKRPCEDIKPASCESLRGVDFEFRKQICEEGQGNMVIQQNCPKSCGLCGAAKWVKTDDWEYEPNHFCFPKIWDSRVDSARAPDLYDCQLECANDASCKAVSWNQKTQACYKAKYCSSSPTKDRDFSIYYKPHNEATPSPTWQGGDRKHWLDLVRLVANDTYGTSQWGAVGGRVEINHNGQWGTVCSHKWKHAENGWANAQVVCKQLGYSRTEGYSTNGEFRGDGTRANPNAVRGEAFPIHLDEVQCAGTEPAIEECFHKDWNDHTCLTDHSQDVGVWCSTFSEEELYNQDPANEQVRLRYPGAEDPSKANEGKALNDLSCHLQNPTTKKYEKHKGADCQAVGGYLEVHARGHWGAVCDDDFTTREANIACRQLGFKHSLAIWDDQTKVNRAERFGEHDINENQIILDDVECIGDETDIFDCYHKPLFVHNCKKTETIAIACTHTPPPNEGLEGKFQLINEAGDTNNAGFYAGRLEVYHNGLWGSVCDDGFDELAAQLVCKDPGINDGKTPYLESYYPEAHFGRSYGPIWLDDFECTGDEEKLLDCKHSEFGEGNCGHGEDVGVSCTSKKPAAGTPGEMRLRGGNSQVKMDTYWEGRLEIFLGAANHATGEWGTVCGKEGWDMKATKVACNNLGFMHPVAYWTDAHFGPGWGKIWLENVKCSSGKEGAITDCSHTIFKDKKKDTGTGRRRMSAGGDDDWWNNDDIFDFDWSDESFGSWGECDHTDDVSIVCSNLDTHIVKDGADIRLVGDPQMGANITHGRLEVRYNDTWGTVCDDGFGQNEANVACMQLGYVKAADNGVFGNAKYGKGLGRIWLDDIDCSKDPETGRYPEGLGYCERSGHYGETDCQHDEDVGIGCSDDETGKVKLCTAAAMEADGCKDGKKTVSYMDMDGKTQSQRVTINEGVLLVNVKGEWGTVCETNYKSWECNKDSGLQGLAKFVCKELNLGPPERYWKNTAYESPIAGISNFKVNWKDVVCRGDEKSIVPFGDGHCAGTNCYDDTGTIDSKCRKSCGDHSRDVHIRCGQPQQWQTYGPKNWQYMTQLAFQKHGDPSYPIMKEEGMCESENTHLEGYEVGGVMHRTGTNAVKRNYTHDGVLVGWQQNWMSASRVFCESMCHMVNEECRYVAYSKASQQCFLYKTCENDGVGLPGFKVFEKVEFDMAGRTLHFEHVRLRGGDVYEEGRLEVYNNHQWSTVCDTGLERSGDKGMWLAHVACSELGFPGAVGYWGASRFGCPADGENIPVALNNVFCDQNSNHIGDCEHEPWGNVTSTTCAYHNNDVSVRCADKITDERVPNGTLKLVDGGEGMYYKTGRLEVAFNGQWGTICDDGFTKETADVACRQLGFAYGAERFYMGNTVAFTHPQGIGHIWMDDVKCNKTHDFLIDCDWSHEHNCRHSEDVGLKCTNEPPKTHAYYDGLVRLVDETGVDVATRPDMCNSTACTGRVQMRETKDAEWGTICNNGLWSDKKWNVANVICKGDLRIPQNDGSSLRFNYAANAWADSDTRWSSGTTDESQWESTPIGMDDVRCNGDEASLLACYALDPGVHNCDHSNDIHITCTNQESVDACKTLNKKFCDTTSTCVEECSICNDLPVANKTSGACGRCEDDLTNSSNGRLCQNAATSGNCNGMSSYEQKKCPASCGICVGTKATIIGTPTKSPTFTPKKPGVKDPETGECEKGYGPLHDCNVKQDCVGNDSTGWRHTVGNVYDCSMNGDIKGNQVDGCHCVCKGGWTGAACGTSPEIRDTCENKWCTGTPNETKELAKQPCQNECMHDQAHNCNRLTWVSKGAGKNEGVCKLWWDDNNSWACTETSKESNDRQNRFVLCLNRAPTVTGGVKGTLNMKIASAEFESNKANIKTAIANAFSIEIEDKIDSKHISIVSHKPTPGKPGLQTVTYQLTNLSENEAEFATQKASDPVMFPYDVQTQLSKLGVSGIDVTCEDVSICASQFTNTAKVHTGDDGTIKIKPTEPPQQQGADAGLIIGLLLLFLAIGVGLYFAYRYWQGRRLSDYTKQDAMLYEGATPQELGKYEAPPIQHL